MEALEITNAKLPDVANELGLTVNLKGTFLNFDETSCSSNPLNHSSSNQQQLDSNGNVVLPSLLRQRRFTTTAVPEKIATILSALTVPECIDDERSVCSELTEDGFESAQPSPTQRESTATTDMSKASQPVSSVNPMWVTSPAAAQATAAAMAVIGTPHMQFRGAPQLCMSPNSSPLTAPLLTPAVAGPSTPMDATGGPGSMECSSGDYVSGGQFVPGIAGPTTVMLRNLPNRYSQDELVEALNANGFKGMYDFFYAPIDFRNKCNVGYCFTNLRSADLARIFKDTFEGLRLPAYRSTKVCTASWARVQGLDQNVEHYRNSPVNEMEHDFRPRLYDTNGTELPFPRGNHAIIAARMRRDAVTGAIQSKHNHRVIPDALPRQQSYNQDEGRKVFIGGLSPTTTADSIRDHLTAFGNVTDVSVIRDNDSNASRGFAFCTFSSPQEVERCLSQTSDHIIDGRSVGIRLYAPTTTAATAVKDQPSARSTISNIVHRNGLLLKL